MANRHGGARRGAGRPMGRRNLRPHGTILAVERAAEGLIPVEFEGDSLDFLRATMQGKIWPTREQIYAAKSILPTEHPPAVTVAGRDIGTIREEIRQEVLGGSRDAAIEKLQDKIQRIRKAMRENTTLDERVRHSIELDLLEIINDEEPDEDDEEGAGAALSDLDTKKLDRVTDLIKELWPTYCVSRRRSGELMPPSPPPAVVKRTPSEPASDDEAGNGGSSEHISQPTLLDNPEQQSEPAEPEVLVPTRGRNGIRWVPLPKRSGEN
jgi:hypothetical protein